MTYSIHCSINYHVSCDLGGHDHTPGWLVINILKFARVKDCRYINIDFSLIVIVIYINTTSTATTTTVTHY